ncbi:MAG: hypothetical protein MUC86_12765 [Burkholderiaceae bacterium]|jgi:hypothetical protein|nr:hypothetical protein [Burkholderiaceae bacterium]
MSAGTSIAICFASAAGDGGLLASAAQRMVATGGVQAEPVDIDSVVVYRFDGHAGAVLMEAARLLHEPALRALRAGAVMAVKVAVHKGSDLKPSEHTVASARAMAAEAPAGRLVLSLRLATMLGLTEPSLQAALKPISLKQANGQSRPATLVELDGGTAPATLSPINGVASLAALDPARRQRLIDQLSTRLVDDLGPIAPILVANVCEESESSADIVRGLAPYLSARGATRLEEVVAEEVRLLYLRSR